MKQDTKYRLRDSEGKEYIIIDTEKVDMQEELNKMITKQMEEIERLTAESTKWESKFYDEAKKVDRAIEYIEKNSYTTIETIDDINYFIVRLDKCVDLLDILKGSDKE